jgi:hypothetical protein
MKTASASSPLSLTVLLMALLFAGVVFVAVTGKRVPLISNPRGAMIALLVLGMAICSMGGIGRVAALGEWTHPLSILGILLGAGILFIGAATIFGLRLPFIQSDLQAVIIVAVLAVVKIAGTVLHSVLPRGG